MPKILTRYFLTLFLARLAFTVSLFAGLITMFDMLANTDAVVKKQPDVVLPLLTYAALRLPEITMMVLPLATLCAVMMALSQLLVRKELVVFLAAGKSLYYGTGIFLFGGIFVLLLHLVLAEWVVPVSAQKLKIWESQNYTSFASKDAKYPLGLWFRSGKIFVYAKDTDMSGRQLFDVIVALRDDAGAMQRYYAADRMKHEAPQLWNLQQVRIWNLITNEEIQKESEHLAVDIQPQDFLTAAREYNELTVRELKVLKDSPVKSEKSASVYELWLQKKYAAPLSIVVMVLLAMPLGMQLARTNRVIVVSVLIIAAGFVFFFFDRFLFSLATKEVIPITLAVWSPMAIFSFVSLGLLLHYHK